LLRELWLVQPLAFARGGSSETPCDAFDWGGPDLSPGGSGRTQIVPADTLIVDRETGSVSLKSAADIEEIIFKDGDHIRPVCPFFELWGAWDEDDRIMTGPVTPEVLATSGKRAADLEWCIEFRNDKAHHWTQAVGDQVIATVELRGDDYTPKPLLGRSPLDKGNPLVPPSQSVPLGSVQLTRPNTAFREFRLRFTPGAGKAYAPANLMQRLGKLQYPAEDEKPPAGMVDFVWGLIRLNNQWKGFTLPPEQCILNPDAEWPKYRLFTELDVEPAVFGASGRWVTVQSLDSDQNQSELMRFLLGGASDSADVRNLPPGLYARVAEPPKLLASLGMIDDFGDGVITCSLKGVGVARARIVSGPPDFAPDRRPPVSLADGLADRTKRAEVRDPGWVLDDQADLAELEIQDMIARAYETMGLANIDATNDYFEGENVSRAKRDNPSADPGAVRRKLWTDDTPVDDDPGARIFLPRDKNWANPLRLTEMGRDAHRRNTASMLFRALVLKNPDFMEKWVRVPAGPDRYYDRKMPGLMRGGDRMPLHLTRRQYDLLANWVRSLHASARGSDK
jgi:hypothetical protein